MSTTEAKTLSPSLGDPAASCSNPSLDEIQQKISSGTSPTDLVKHLRTSRTNRMDYTSSMLISPTNGVYPVNCHRCYRLKKKCSKEAPRCQYCVHTNHDCFYVDRKKAKHNFESEYAMVSANAVQEGRVKTNKSPNRTQNSSCLRCIRVKRKCSRSLPCNLCRLTGNNCVYDKRNRFDELVSVALGPEDRVNSESSSATSDGNNVTIDDASNSEPTEGTEEEFKQIDDHVPVHDHRDRIVSSNDADLINLPSFSDNSLPYTFIDNFFYNYRYIYPIIDKDSFVSEVSSIDFSDESIVNLKIYLVLTVGCLVSDSANGTSHFANIFNANMIELISDSINVNIYDQDSFTLLFLLALYYTNKNDFDQTWNLLGTLDRLVIRYEIYKKPEMSGLFWCIHNLDKDISSITDRPSQLPLPQIVKLPDHENDLIGKFIDYYKLEDRINNFKLSDQKAQDLRGISNEIEKWRIAISTLLHTTFVDSSNLQEYTTFVNLYYFYLCIEVDEASQVKLSQFILQFLSQFFALTLNETQKTGVGLTINNLVYSHKLFKIIKYNVNNLFRFRKDGYVENLQIILNLLKYMNNDKIGKLIEACTQLNERVRDNTQDLFVLQQEVLRVLDDITGYV